MQKPIGNLSQEQTTEYLKELSALANKYGYRITGCGCCGSPGFTDTEPGEYTHSGISTLELDWLDKETNNETKTTHH